MSAIQAIRTSQTQTLLHVDASYNQVVAAFGPPDVDRETDKSWHGWEVTTPGETVEVYDYARHLGSERPSNVPDEVITWHINADGDDHERAARSIANAITGWRPPAEPGGWVDPISGLDTYVRNNRENGLVVAIDDDEHVAPAVSIGITEVWGGLDEAVSHTLSPRMARRLAQLLTSAADHVDALDALSKVHEHDDSADERLCGVLYSEVGTPTGDALLGSLSGEALTDLVGHYQVRRCPSCTEVAHAAVFGEIERRREVTHAPGVPADPWNPDGRIPRF